MPDPDTRARLEAFEVAMRTTTSKSERREVLRQFLSFTRDLKASNTQEARFREWLRSEGHGWAFRAAGESTGTGGGNVVPPGFAPQLIRFMREYDTLIGAFEHYDSPHGFTIVRPAYSAFAATSEVTENPVSGITEGPEPVLSQQSWPEAPTYAASYTASRQLVDDAGINVDSWVAAALGESMGRAIAPNAQTALYAAIATQGNTSGQNGGYVALGAATAVNFASGATTELAADTLALDTAAQMTSALDEAYAENARWYFSRTQWAGILRQVSTTDKKIQYSASESDRSLYGYPVELTSQTKSATASTVSGPLFGDLGMAMTLRTAADPTTFALLRSTERFAELLQVYFRAAIRADVMARDIRAVVGVKYAAS